MNAATVNPPLTAGRLGTAHIGMGIEFPGSEVLGGRIGVLELVQHRIEGVAAVVRLPDGDRRKIVLRAVARVHVHTPGAADR